VELACATPSVVIADFKRVRHAVAPHDVEYNAEKGAQRIVSIFFTHARTLKHGRCGREACTCTCKASQRFKEQAAGRAFEDGVDEEDGGSDEAGDGE